MATLSVWKFDTPDGAKEAEELLLSLQKQGLVTLDDAAIVYWEPGKRAPKTRQLHNLAAVGALGGTFWGVLFGLLFFVPILGAAVGAAAGAVGGALTDVGIDDDFIRSVRDTITEGTSALFRSPRPSSSTRRRTPSRRRACVRSSCTPTSARPRSASCGRSSRSELRGGLTGGVRARPGIGWDGPARSISVG